ncbi:phosphoribosylanthranilate isomerase [Methanohalophilus sp. RSK]|uniref:phosphoribosylanthranilate isomerase n=1 Tax=Methanohalophilus sp. RSK TaxID=2485783 RepID=UPI0013142205|nr:phosphoribosylanthranilate isomerase [Methanohalophilus sp. RSK]
MQPAIRVKICGMKSVDDIGIAAKCGADAVGFITEVPVDTPRNLNLELSTELIKATPPFVTTVMVIMPESIEHAKKLVSNARPDMVQVHSTADKELLTALRATHVRIIQKFSISDKTKVQETIKIINELAEYNLLDAVILDTACSSGGGSGLTHDWNISSEVAKNIPVPLIVAGGLNPQNVDECVNIVSPYGVDVSSGVEVKGKKDLDLVCDFIGAVRCSN